MVYLYLCDACLRGDHENCSKGNPAPKGVYGGSKCKCFDLSHNYKPTEMEWEHEKRRTKELQDGIEQIFKVEDLGVSTGMVGGISKKPCLNIGQTKTNTPRTDEIVEYLAIQFPATVGHIPIREKIEKLEQDLNDALVAVEMLSKTLYHTRKELLYGPEEKNTKI